MEAFAPDAGGDGAPRQPVLLGHRISKVTELGQVTPGGPLH